MSNSIGDLRNSGLQGNNWPWQYKVLQGLECICNGIGQNLTPQQRTPNVLNDTGIGSVPTCYGFSIANIGSAAGIVGGQSLPAGATVNFDAGAMNNFFSGITYDATGTTFLITWIT
jgi:hypothetical protein